MLAYLVSCMYEIIKPLLIIDHLMLSSSEFKCQENKNKLVFL